MGVGMVDGLNERSAFDDVVIGGGDGQVVWLSGIGVAMYMDLCFIFIWSGVATVCWDERWAGRKDRSTITCVCEAGWKYRCAIAGVHIFGWKDGSTITGACEAGWKDRRAISGDFFLVGKIVM